MSITTNQKPAKVPRLLQLPRSTLDSKVLTMLDIFDTELALSDKRAHDWYVTAATKTALHYDVSTETMRGARLLFLTLRFYRNSGTLAPHTIMGQKLIRETEEFFKTHELRSA